MNLWSYWHDDIIFLGILSGVSALPPLAFCKEASYCRLPNVDHFYASFAFWNLIHNKQKPHYGQFVLLSWEYFFSWEWKENTAISESMMLYSGSPQWAGICELGWGFAIASLEVTLQLWRGARARSLSFTYESRRRRAFSFSLRFAGVSCCL